LIRNTCRTSHCEHYFVWKKPNYKLIISRHGLIIGYTGTKAILGDCTTSTFDHRKYGLPNFSYATPW